MKNTVQLMNDLTDLPYDRNIKFASLDITNTYSNVPINEMITTLNKLCEINNIEDETKQDIMKIAQVVAEQNYFRFQDNLCTKRRSCHGSPDLYIFRSLFAIHGEHQNFRTTAKTQS
jgi:hypothetical protein